MRLRALAACLPALCLFALACAKPEANTEAPVSERPAAAATPASTATPQPLAAPSAQAEWARVEDPTQVCMVNNQFMGAPQIPVEVDGKTYFGCCEMCKGRLATDPSSRRATDPQTGKEVDKSSAQIAKNLRGQVQYFESEASLNAFLQR